jgi:hypothetical protein
MYKGYKLLTKKEHKHLIDNELFKHYGCTTYAIDELYKVHKASEYPLCEECKNILIKLGYAL